MCGSIERTFLKFSMAFLFNLAIESAIPSLLRVGISSGIISRTFSLSDIASFQFLLMAALIAFCCKSCELSLFMLRNDNEV